MTAAAPNFACRSAALASARLLGLLLALLLSQTACTTIVTPPDPATLGDPVSVYLVDYHRHSSLMLPRGEEADGVLREYAYGEWAWFAQNRTGVLRAAGALLLPSQGALGRADHPMPASAAHLRDLNGFEAVYELRVERGRAHELLERLDLRFESRLDTMIWNPRAGLQLVMDDDRYSLVNHCNHATVAWLRDLDVRAWPVSTVARFRIRTPAAPTSPNHGR